MRSNYRRWLPFVWMLLIAVAVEALAWQVLQRSVASRAVLDVKVYLPCGGGSLSTCVSSSMSRCKSSLAAANSMYLRISGWEAYRSVHAAPPLDQKLHYGNGLVGVYKKNLLEQYFDVLVLTSKPMQRSASPQELATISCFDQNET